MTVQDVINRIGTRILQIEGELEELREDGEMWDPDWFALKERKKELVFLRDILLEEINY